MLLELDRISLSYQKGTLYEKTALSDISLTIEEGECVGIAGPTGSGKSTLLAVMAGVLEPLSGRLLLDGRRLDYKAGPPPGSIGLAFQSPESCLFEKTVFDEVAFAPSRLGVGGEALAARVAASLASLGLDEQEIGSRSPFSLSAGEQRRLALAAIIASGAGALFFDEPTAYLDPLTGKDLAGRLLSMNREQGSTIVIAGHDMDEMAALARRLIIISDGRIAADGPAADLLRDADLLAGYGLEPPGTVKLCELLGSRSGDKIRLVLSEQEAASLLRDYLGGRNGA